MNAPEVPDLPAARVVETGTHRGVPWALLGNTIPGFASWVNGYVWVPSDHPWFTHGDLHARAPGSVTYGPDLDGWLGFDTMHGFDRWDLEELATMGLEPVSWKMPDLPGAPTLAVPDEVPRWTLARVRDAVLELAEQAVQARVRQ